jgi:hypothetical protein
MAASPLTERWIVECHCPVYATRLSDVDVYSGTLRFYQQGACSIPGRSIPWFRSRMLNGADVGPMMQVPKDIRGNLLVIQIGEYRG